MHYFEAESKKISVEGHIPLHSTTPPQTQPPSAPAAPRPVFANPLSYFFTILTLDSPVGPMHRSHVTTTLCVLQRIEFHRSELE